MFEQLLVKKVHCWVVFKHLHVVDCPLSGGVENIRATKYVLNMSFGGSHRPNKPLFGGLRSFWAPKCLRSRKPPAAESTNIRLGVQPSENAQKKGGLLEDPAT